MHRIWSSCLVFAVALVWVNNSFAVENGVRILFDQGHNQRFLIEKTDALQLSGLADIMRGHGADVISTEKTLDDDTLQDINALVISGPFQALTPDEVEAVARFIERGGRLVAMLHIGQPLSGMLARLGLDHSNVVLHERSNIINEDINFKVTGLSDSPLFADLKQFSVYGCWALDPGKTGTPIAQTSPDAWVDLDGDKILSKGDMTGVFNVVVSGTLGAGSFVVFGDDAIFQNRYLDENNRRLAANLSGWLAGR